MSTFPGLIEEMPGISVDRFDDCNLKSSVFFLSHCHSDHMTGLNRSFFEKLKYSNQYLYCSPISKAILEGIHPQSTNGTVKSIEFIIPQSIKYTSSENDSQNVSYVTVTSVPAGHCPGSVMFIFEKTGETILYTGDFRINPKDYPKISPLHYSKGCPKKFDKIYLDTTFLHPDFPYLPSRMESCEEICRATETWLNKHPNNLVVLECSASYGSEYLFMELSQRLHTKVHVKPNVYKNHIRIHELAPHVTNDSLSTRIHACGTKRQGFRLPCRQAKNEHILTIVPSTQRWAGKRIERTKITEMDWNMNRLYVCYSTHPSLEELTEFIKYFQPKQIFPSVCPPELENQIHILLSQIMNKPEEQSEIETPICRLKYIPPKKSRKFLNSKYFDSDSDDDLS